MNVELTFLGFLAIAAGAGTIVIGIVMLIEAGFI